MKILYLDDFKIYDQVRTSGAMSLQWLEKEYEVRQTTTSNLRLKQSTATDPYQRLVLANGASASGQRSIYLPLGKYLLESNVLTISQKLVDFTPSNVSISGLSIVSGSTNNYILTFGFNTARSGFIRYVNNQNRVVEDTFTLPTSLSRRFDTIEWTFEKETQNRREYRDFILWVNNRHVYSGSVFCQAGSAGSLAARLLGGVSTLPIDEISTNGYLTSSDNVTIPAYGTTDIVVTNGQRPGRIRVISRQPAGDIGPNTMIPSKTVNEHAELVNTIPPVEADYLTAVSSAAQEVYWSQAYEDLSSENVLAVAIRLLGQKNSPDAMDMVPLFSSNFGTHEAEPVPTDLTPRFSLSILDKNPWTNLNWTPLEANSLQYGMKVA